jgi:hypothetical protein
LPVRSLPTTSRGPGDDKQARRIRWTTQKS